eukprot:CAMPEP_0118681320 /NCGR_PEP_ID=MMETSP0800-20121206/4870_1 /TAXON_ID=210618 ORGANISM="Striatella unipunctata, Strain CCMP2910" /NCGR_SAMPLE_ID=MMETSP0800 /ASSEMBLY_ACC=CAM_ASM_000638 /LENGTH=172 /DNA_ID=CAMNT_0006577597 /DNA_START=112 /DNA_END=630 /DNA_ORIENTATION=+
MNNNNNNNNNDGKKVLTKKERRRASNRRSAQKSRYRQLIFMEELGKREDALKKENTMLKEERAELEAQIRTLLDLRNANRLDASREDSSPQIIEPMVVQSHQPSVVAPDADADAVANCDESAYPGISIMGGQPSLIASLTKQSSSLESQYESRLRASILLESILPTIMYQSR